MSQSSDEDKETKIEGSTENVELENDGNEPRRPDNCVTNRDRYSWRKWIRCWRDLQEMNAMAKARFVSRNGEQFKPDRMPAWSPTWKKRKGWMWQLGLASFEDKLNEWEEREYAKREWEGRPPFVEYCTEYDSEDWDNLSNPREPYSSDNSFDSGEDYESDF